MTKLILNIDQVDKKWDEYIKETFGDDFFNSSKIEPYATAKKNRVKVYNLKFKNNKNIIDKIKTNDKIISAYIVENNKIKETVK